LTSSVPSEGTYFTKLAFKALKGKAIENGTAEDSFECFWKCERLQHCLSLNLANLLNKDGLYECVLMGIDKTDSSGVLQSSQIYHHYTRLVVSMIGI
jgi:hypothetical protein